MGKQEEGPWRIGWNSIRANRVPMLVLWGAVLLLTVAYRRLNYAKLEPEC